MDHPAIAKVFDAGATQQGRPYFAMEYVDGIPITTYCDRHRLTMRARLQLFIEVCEGVQHAHQKAIIHRDLKPSNILVTEVNGKPMPRIIDFGVAKAVSQGLNAETMFTRVGMVLGTPGYMSPEQADSAGQDIDTRSDVYSLGAILYELLVGQLPSTSASWLSTKYCVACANRMRCDPARACAHSAPTPLSLRRTAAPISPCWFGNCAATPTSSP
jgi:serine/threonine protein kinase